MLIIAVSLLSVGLVSRATERNRRPERAAWYEEPLAGARVGAEAGCREGGEGGRASQCSTPPGMGCRCRQPHGAQHPCGEENRAGLALEPAVHV